MAPGVTGISLVNAIETEIERAKQDLKGVDENLRKLTGRDFSDPSQRGEQRRVRLSSGGRDDEPPAKRRPPGGVFARLGGVVQDQQHMEHRGKPRGDHFRGDPRGEHRPGEVRGDLRAEIHGDGRGRRVQEVAEDDEKMPKPSLPSSVARPQADMKSRTEAAAELTKDRASRDRNRRMFGALLGTLKRFKNDEAKQKDKEEQRAAIERKLEEKGRVEKEELRRERLDLINQRQERRAQIKLLTIKMARVKEHEQWEAHQMKLTKFIRTKSTPSIFWIPRTHTAKTTGLVRASHDKILSELEEDRLRMKEELEEILGSRTEDDQGELGRDAAEGGEEEEEETFVHRGVRSAVARQGEGGVNTSFDNCPDLLDYEAEEGELVFGEADLSGKDDDDTERMVVQVDGRGEGSRKVEIVASQPEEITIGISKDNKGNDSEKENEGRQRDLSKERDRHNREKDRSRDAERERKNKERGKDKDRIRDKDRERELDREKGKDRVSAGRDKEKDKSKERSKDTGEREKNKDNGKSREQNVYNAEVELEATVVHVKIEKDNDENNQKSTDPVLKKIKEEKHDKSSVTPEITNQEVASSNPSASPAATLPHLPSTTALTSSLEAPPVNKIDDQREGHEQEPVSPEESRAHIEDDHLSSHNPSSGRDPLPIDGKDNQDEHEKGEEIGSNRKVSKSKHRDEKAKAAKAERAHKKHEKKNKKLKGEDKKKKKDSGSSEDSSSEDSSSDSSSESSDSASSDSESSSSSSGSSSGSSSDSESDSSSSSSTGSESESDRERKKRRRRQRGRESRSGESSSDSEGEQEKKKKKTRKMKKKKDLAEQGKSGNVKIKEEPQSDEEKGKKDQLSKEKNKEKEVKGKDKESHKVKEGEKEREREAIRRREREKEKERDRDKKHVRSKSKERQRARSRSRERRRDRSRSRDKERKSDRKDRR